LYKKTRDKPQDFRRRTSLQRIKSDFPAHMLTDQLAEIACKKEGSAYSAKAGINNSNYIVGSVALDM
jgi:hypothetical protein